MGYYSYKVAPYQSNGVVDLLEKQVVTNTKIGSDDEFEFSESIEIRVKGSCSECEKEFDVTLRSTDGTNLDYSCICGFFTFFGETEEVREDSHGIRKEEWIRRRREYEREGQLLDQQT